MLSYPIDEAEEMLCSKLSAAKASLANCEEDLDFLREQVTVGFAVAAWVLSKLANPNQTMEVAVARVYNWDVVQKRKEKEEEDKQKEKRKGKETEGPPGG